MISNDVKKQMAGKQGEILLSYYFQKMGAENVRISGNPFSEADINFTYKGDNFSGEIKTQTPYVKKHRVSYPIRKAQIDKLLKTSYVWFLCKADSNMLPSFKYEGNLYKAKAKDVHSWITDTHKLKYKTGELTKHDPYKNIFWFNIPLNESFIKLVYKFDKKDMIPFRNIGVSDYKTTNVGTFYRSSNKNYAKEVI